MMQSHSDRMIFGIDNGIYLSCGTRVQVPAPINITWLVATESDAQLASHHRTTMSQALGADFFLHNDRNCQE